MNQANVIARLGKNEWEDAGREDSWENGKRVIAYAGRTEHYFLYDGVDECDDLKLYLCLKRADKIVRVRPIGSDGKITSVVYGNICQHLERELGTGRT